MNLMRNSHAADRKFTLKGPFFSNRGFCCQSSTNNSIKPSGNSEVTYNLLKQSKSIRFQIRIKHAMKKWQDRQQFTVDLHWMHHIVVKPSPNQDSHTNLTSSCRRNHKSIHPK
eukprot:TRINITY_DN37850_c0_g3_i1.p1 TRINITY_DN37850_c0_g3~~TRINITY_DN37850_c0_g3_i1.p1  ORF type:complete len:113 (-),score=8.76 TRINITY_DN37850_c0_g3_i1:1418-1756(-)